MLSAVKNNLGKGEAVSSILTGSTIFSNKINMLRKWYFPARALGFRRGSTMA